MYHKYNTEFYQSQKTGGIPSAKKIAPLINERIHPKSIIDIGCGVGCFIYAFHELDNSIDYIGVDGDYLDTDLLLFDKKYFVPLNLEERIIIQRKYDLAISLEVAEHLSHNRAESFVNDLTNLSDVILFSAAIPNQGNGAVNHINEQPMDYWISLFKKNGYIAIDYVRPLIHTDKDVGLCYRNNCLVFVRKGTIDYNSIFEGCNMDEEIDTISIHPELKWLMKYEEVISMIEKNPSIKKNIGFYCLSEDYTCIKRNRIIYFLSKPYNSFKKLRNSFTKRGG